MKPQLILALLGLLIGCGQRSEPACPVIADLVPASVDAAYVSTLTRRLAGDDRENSITEAIAELRRRDPKIAADTITNILIAADCPNVITEPNSEIDHERERVARLRAQVEVLLEPPTGV